MCESLFVAKYIRLSRLNFLYAMDIYRIYTYVPAFKRTLKRSIYTPAICIQIQYVYTSNLKENIDRPPAVMSQSKQHN